MTFFYFLEQKGESAFSLLQSTNDEKVYPVLEKLFKLCLCKDNSQKIDLSNLQLPFLSPLFVKLLIDLNIKVIDLRNNKLESIPEEFGHLPFDKVKLDGNPLSLIPRPFRDSWPKIHKYLHSLKNRAARWKERKVLIVGEEATGKSTLLKCFCTKKNKVSCKENLATDGIKITSNISLINGKLGPNDAIDMEQFSISAWYAYFNLPKGEFPFHNVKVFN